MYIVVTLQEWYPTTRQNTHTASELYFTHYQQRTHKKKKKEKKKRKEKRKRKKHYKELLQLRFNKVSNTTVVFDRRLGFLTLF